MGTTKSWKARRRNATRRRLEAETAALAHGWADCEAALLAGLQALTEKEDERADNPSYPPTLRQKHQDRAACLRELIFAVAAGQFRTDAYDDEALLWAHGLAAQPDAQATGRAGGLKAAGNMTPEQRQARARAAGLARGRKNRKEAENG